MRKSLSILMLSAAGLLADGSLTAQTLTGADVMDKYYHIAKPKTQIMTMAMTISKNGSTLSRTMTTWGQETTLRARSRGR